MKRSEVTFVTTVRSGLRFHEPDRFWTAPVLWRFLNPLSGKAPEDWRSPKRERTEGERTVGASIAARPESGAPRKGAI
jgi:hypothetical protein